MMTKDSDGHIYDGDVSVSAQIINEYDHYNMNKNYKATPTNNVIRIMILIIMLMVMKVMSLISLNYSLQDYVLFDLQGYRINKGSELRLIKTSFK